MQVDYDQHTLAAVLVVAEVAVKPVATHPPFGTAVGGIVEVVRIERIKIAVAKGRLING